MSSEQGAVKTRNPYVIAIMASLGMALAVLNTTLINIILVPVSKDLKIDLSTTQWLVTGYLLAQAAVIPLSAYLSNRFGPKTVFIWSIAIFTVGALFCSLAQDPTLLIFARALQGIGGGCILPVATTISIDAFPPDKRTGAVSISSIPTLLAPIFGPILGGWLNDAFSWHALFLINVPLGLAVLAACYFVIPANKASLNRSVKLDWTGLVLAIAGIVLVVYAFTVVNQTDPATKTAANPNGSAYGWSYWLFWTLLATGLVLLTIFAVYALKFTKTPLLDLRLYKKYNFTIASIVSWASAVILYGILLLLPVFFQRYHSPNMTAFDSGLALVPQGTGMLVGIMVAGAILARVGARMVVVGGVILMALAMWQFSQVTPTTDGWALLPWTLLAGAGIGFAVMPVSIIALRPLTGVTLANGNALFNATRQIFSSLTTAVLTSLLVQQTIYHATQLQAAMAQGGQTPSANSSQAQAMLAQLTSQAGTAAIKDLFGYLTVGSAVVILLALLLPGRTKIDRNQDKTPLVIEEIEAIEGLEAGYSPAVQVPNRA